MQQGERQDLGVLRGVRLSAGAVEPVGIGADLLIVGMPVLGRAGQDSQAVDALDAALAGTLSQLRAGRVFDGEFGETLTLSRPPPPVRSRALMIVGMGDAAALDPDRLGLLTEVAMGAALQIQTRAAACLLSLPDPDPPLALVLAAARARMRGALRAITAHRDGGPHDPFHWVFALRPPHRDRALAELAETLRNHAE